MVFYEGAEVFCHVFKAAAYLWTQAEIKKKNPEKETKKEFSTKN